MTDKIISQVRWYNDNGNYSNTTTVEHGAGSNNDVSGIFGFVAPGKLPVNPCNVMIRRNGKLVSYKEFV
ncbi:MAG: hypothetical protein ACRC6V_10455 [Bacteroidales bacterium]